MFDITRTKEELNKLGVIKKPKNFYFTRGVSDKRGYNALIMVYVIAKDGEPYRLGYNYVNTASYRGDSAEARHLVREVYGYKLKDGYKFSDENIKVRELL